MLKKILQEFQSNQGLLDLNQLSRKLNIEPAALEGMLEHLVQLGKLEKESTSQACSIACSECSFQDCRFMNAAQSGFRWKLKT
jgi:hypothetical protein